MSTFGGEMDITRFIAFSRRLDRIVKNIKRKEMAYMREYGLRSVHITCLLCIDMHEDGATVTELSRECDTDKALISRTVKELCSGGFVAEIGEGGKNYNRRYTLSDNGREVIEGLKTVISEYVTQARENIDPADMKIFYTVLSEFERNIAQITK